VHSRSEEHFAAVWKAAVMARSFDRPGAMVGPEIVDRVASHGDQVAVSATDGVFSYPTLSHGTHRVASALRDVLPERADVPVVLMVRPSYAYVAAMLGVWRAGALAVPVGVTLPEPELEYVLDDASPAVVVVDDTHAPRLKPLARGRGIRLLHVDELLGHTPAALPPVHEAQASLMLYTSGTTGRPKGVVHSHASIAAQVRGMVEAWQWARDDHILCTLPLHHVHGIVNVVACALWCGARCDVLPEFDAHEVWQRIATGELTLFMAVPTIYRRLIDAYNGADGGVREAWAAGAASLRLMVSGSAALPVPTLERWRTITGHTLLERYGMTEIGMALSNTLTDRRPGHVGVPMPGVEVRLVDESGAPVRAGVPGEIHVRGANVFREYWGRADATRDAFASDWFRTGDVAVLDAGSYRILGRASVDIIKTGGEKVSALEVEDVLREHPAIADCAVIGVPDDEWGERVCAAVVVASDADIGDLRAWAKERIAPYKVPREVVVVDDLPRNAMGKVTKPDVVKLFG
jgi:malonyl-CoA/methylmalonyl-CoA synthetase